MKNVTPKGVIYLHKGVSTLCWLNLDTARMVGGILGRGDWLFAGTIDSDVRLFGVSEELEPVTLLLFPERAVLELAAKSDEVFKWLFYSMQRMQLVWHQANLNAMHNLNARVAYGLIDLASKAGVATSSAPVIRISQQQLANVTGITRPRVNEALKQFEKAGELKVIRGGIKLLDIDALAARLQNLNLMFRDPRQVLNPRAKELR